MLSGRDREEGGGALEVAMVTANRPVSLPPLLPSLPPLAAMMEVLAMKARVVAAVRMHTTT